MLKRSEVAALSKAAIQRVASGKAGKIPPIKRHTERLEEEKRKKAEVQFRRMTA